MHTFFHLLISDNWSIDYSALKIFCITWIFSFVFASKRSSLDSTIILFCLQEAKADQRLSNKKDQYIQKKDTRLTKEVEVRDSGNLGVKRPEVRLGPGDLGLPSQKNIHPESSFSTFRLVRIPSSTFILVEIILRCELNMKS